MCGATLVAAGVYSTKSELTLFKAFHGLHLLVSKTALSPRKDIKAAFMARTRRPMTRRPMPAPVDKPVGLNRTSFDRVLQPVMTPGEVLTLQWYASQGRTYVEYGSGASTMWVAPLAARALSIENQAQWCESMLARTDVSFWRAQGKLQYECINTGETGDWGVPTNVTDNARFADYVDAISLFGSDTGSATASLSIIDVILIDGRFRVACALKALWYIDEASVVIIHDNFKRVADYSAVLVYYDIVDSVDSMAILRQKSVVDWQAATSDLDRFVYVPRRKMM